MSCCGGWLRGLRNLRMKKTSDRTIAFGLKKYELVAIRVDLQMKRQLKERAGEQSVSEYLRDLIRRALDGRCKGCD